MSDNNGTADGRGELGVDEVFTHMKQPHSITTQVASLQNETELTVKTF